MSFGAKIAVNFPRYLPGRCLRGGYRGRLGDYGRLSHKGRGADLRRCSIVITGKPAEWSFVRVVANVAPFYWKQAVSSPQSID